MVSYRRDLVDDRLLNDAHETLDVEYKGWLDLTVGEHQADLAKAILALANHGGGLIVIGFADRPLVATPAPDDLDARYTTDTVNNIVIRYADPVFHVEVTRRKGHPVLLVPGGHRVPVLARRSGPNDVHVRQHDVYIRRPGPRSESPQTSFEWRELFDRIKRNDLEAVALPAADAPTNVTAPEVPGPPSVAERMSNTPRPHARVIGAVELAHDDRNVLEGSISQERVQKFREELLDEWEQLPMTALFKSAGSFRRLDVYQPELRFGVAMATFKGPFVDQSNWVDLQGREFALGLERFLLDRFVELLEARLDDGRRIGTSAEGIAEFVAEAANRMREEGATPDLGVLIGRLPEADAIELYRITNWQNPAIVRGVDVSNVTFMHRPIGGLPLLWFRSDRAPLLSVVDLDDYYVERTNAAEDDQQDILVTVAPIDDADARRRIRDDRGWLSSLYGSVHPNEQGELSVEEAVTQLRLRVRLDIVAAGTVREAYMPCTQSASLV